MKKVLLLLFAGIVLNLYAFSLDYKYNFAPEFELPYYNDINTLFKLSEYIGQKNIVFLFFSIHCRHCTAEVPYYDKAALKHENAYFFLIHYKEIPENIDRFMKEKQVNLDCLWDKDGKIFKLFNITATPNVVVINKKGEIVMSGYHKLPDVEKLLESLD